MPHLTGAKATIATLRAHNVDTIFGIPGAHTLPLYDAMRDEVGLRHSAETITMPTEMR